ncbi:hypothetical protein DENSPDRAFT_128742 [Dentipellis sp. KUC8613]|nr:hypothetical protein DENSPDRAFT_128742 [Dentipellis sp. KUC8613]
MRSSPALALHALATIFCRATARHRAASSGTSLRRLTHCRAFLHPTVRPRHALAPMTSFCASLRRLDHLATLSRRATLPRCTLCAALRLWISAPLSPTPLCPLASRSVPWLRSGTLSRRIAPCDAFSTPSAALSRRAAPSGPSHCCLPPRRAPWRRVTPRNAFSAPVRCPVVLSPPVSLAVCTFIV